MHAVKFLAVVLEALGIATGALAKEASKGIIVVSYT